MISNSPPRGRGPYAKTAKVRIRILEACAEVFAEMGYRSTTMKEVARRADISQRGLTHHFPSKADLLIALLEDREARNTERVPHVPGLEALSAMLEILAADSAYPEIVELHATLSTESASPTHPAHQHYRARYDLVREAATASFAVLRLEGRIRSPLTDADLGAAFVALSDGLQLQWLYERGATQSAHVLRRFLGAIVVTAEV